jgi:hypothetical protein
MAAFGSQSYPFTQQAILALSASLRGVYGLWRENTWVYVGRGTIHDRLLAHLNGDNPCITQAGPTNFAYTQTNDAEAEKGRLILLLTPSCNKKVG